MSSFLPTGIISVRLQLHILQTISTPVLQGSLKSTLHGVDHQPGSLLDLQDWSCEAIEVKTLKSFHLSVFQQHHIISLLLAHFPNDEITFRKYSTLEYRSERYFSRAYQQNRYITLA